MTDTLYKLTDVNARSCGGDTVIKWGNNVTHVCSRPNKPPHLCTGSVIHAYESFLVAAIIDPIYGNYGYKARLWMATGDIVIRDKLVCGVRELTTTYELPLPVITAKQRVDIAISCIRLAYHELEWVEWAERWSNIRYVKEMSEYMTAVILSRAILHNGDIDLHNIIADILKIDI